MRLASTLPPRTSNKDAGGTTGSRTLHQLLCIASIVLVTGQAVSFSSAQEEVKPVDPLPTAVPLTSIPSVPDALKQQQISQDPASLPSAKFMPEGTFVTDREGKLVVTDSGDVILVPVAGSDLPLMVVLPCQRLEQMLASRAANGPESKFLLSGQVFVYRGREFLLPTLFAISRGTHSALVQTPAKNNESQPASGTGGSTPAATAPTNTNPTQPTAESTDPRVSDLIRDLEASRNSQRRIMPTPTPPSAQPNASIPMVPVAPPSPTPPTSPTTAPGQGTEVNPANDGGNPAGAVSTLANEGTVLVSKRGRVVRLPAEGGRLALAIDNDPNSPGAAPMILQPSRMMEQLESVAAGRGEEFVLRVSGRVMVFEGKNFLLPTFYQFVPKMDVTPRQ